MIHRLLSITVTLTFAFLTVNPNFTALLPFSSYGEFSLYVKVSSNTYIPAVQEVTLLSYRPSDSIIFTGDIMLARNVEYLMKKNGCDYPFKNTELLKPGANSYVFGNFEASIPKQHVVTPELGLRFSVESECLPALNDAGFTHLSLANNHSFDFGKSGFLNTVDVLDDFEFNVFGSYDSIEKTSISFVETTLGTVSVIGVHALLGEISDQDLSYIFSFANSNSVRQIVYVHWGDEYVTNHNTAQEKLARRLIDNGADLIIGHHPHVVQDIQLVDSVPVFYSLGNYVFDQYFSSDVQQGLVLSLDLSGVPKINLLPVSSEKTLSSPKFMSEKTAQKFLNELSRRSSNEISEQIKNGTIIWHSEVASSPKVAIMTR